MRILIGQSYFRVLDPKELQRQMPYPPLGPLYAATILRDKDHEVHFFDAMLANNPEQFLSEMQAVKPDLILIYDDEFNYLTKMCLSNMRDAALSFIKEAKQQNIPIILYSSDATDHSPVYLQHGCDAIIVGEAEITLQEVVKAYENGRFEDTKESIDGLRFLKNDSVFATPKRNLLKDLDVLPDPDYNFVDIDAYREIWLDRHGCFSLNISTTRGCPYHCNWCAKPIYGQVYHSRSSQRVAQQIKNLKEQYNIDHIWFTDDIFGLKPEWIPRFADECEKLNVHIPYKCLTRPDLLLRGDTIEDLKRSGCSDIWVGAESGSQKILDGMDKGTQVPQVYESAQRVHEMGMEISFFIQFGYTGEKWDDILLTRKMIRDCVPDDIGISVSYPLPGTKFYERVKNQMKDKTNWTDSDDLDMMFSGTYERSFYKILHRFVHAEYRMMKILKRKQWSELLKGIFLFVRFIQLRLKIASLVKT